MCQFEQLRNQPDFSRDKNNINNFWTFKNAIKMTDNKIPAKFVISFRDYPIWMRRIL
jgi:hypothetical protein